MARLGRLMVAAMIAALLLPAIPRGFGDQAVRAAGNPFVGYVPYADPFNPAKKQADAWRNSRPGDAALLDLVWQEQTVEWIGSWLPPANVTTYIDQRVTTVSGAGGLPIFAAYNVPNRDCGGYSQGGATNAAEYRAWIDTFAAGIGQRKAVVLVEPDCLTVTDCFDNNPAALAERFALISYAVGVFKRNPHAVVYIDGGDNNRNRVDEIVPILQAANIAQADGFFLNSTVYQYTSAEIAYGRAVGMRLGGKHFVVDTSRSGLGPNAEWCNARGRALGVAPTTVTGEPLADAFLWIKPVWQSDGACDRGEPGAGQHYFDYTLDLVRRSLQPFSDMPADPAAAAIVRELALRGFIRGNGDGTFGTTATTLRAQMAALIARPLFWELERWGSTPFPDKGQVDDALWRNVGTLAHYNVALGYGDGTYNPTGEVLYQQVILFISRAMVQAGLWQRQPDNPQYFPNLPGGTAREQADRADIATYVHYTQNLGGVPDRPATGPFTAWDQPAPRVWFAVALYRALLSVGSVPQLP